MRPRNAVLAVTISGSAWSNMGNMGNMGSWIVVFGILGIGDFTAKPAPPDPLINADPATEADRPMTGALLLSGTVQSEDGPTRTGFIPNCSSTLIAPDVVLTAAHCVDPLALDDSGFLVERMVWSRQVDLYDRLLALMSGIPNEDPPADAVEVIAAALHPGWQAGLTIVGLGRLDDVALLFLAEPVETVRPAVLPSSTADDGVQPGERATVVGWGLQTTEQPADESNRFYGVKRIGKSPIGAVGDYEFQLGTDPSDPRQCSGDSGGPVFEKDTTMVIGIASRTWDESGCQSRGAVNTRVAPYRDWIERTMTAACDQGVRSSCEDPGLPELEPEVEDDDDDDGSSGGCAVAGSGRDGSVWMLLVLALGRFRRRVRRRASRADEHGSGHRLSSSNAAYPPPRLGLGVLDPSRLDRRCI